MSDIRKILSGEENSFEASRVYQAFDDAGDLEEIIKDLLSVDETRAALIQLLCEGTDNSSALGREFNRLINDLEMPA